MTKTATYKVNGMDCMGCVKSITRSIKGLQPNVEPMVDLEAGLVTVPAEVPAADIATAAQQSGFEFIGKI